VERVSDVDRRECSNGLGDDHHSEHRLSLYQCSGDNHWDAESFSGKIGIYDSSKVVFGNGGVYEHDINGELFLRQCGTPVQHA